MEDVTVAGSLDILVNEIGDEIDEDADEDTFFYADDDEYESG